MLQQNHLIRKNAGHLAQINSGTVRVSFYCMFQVFFSQQFLHEMMSPASPRCFGMLQHILIVQLPPNFPGRVANIHPRSLFFFGLFPQSWEMPFNQVTGIGRPFNAPFNLSTSPFSPFPSMATLRVKPRHSDCD